MALRTRQNGRAAEEQEQSPSERTMNGGKLQSLSANASIYGAAAEKRRSREPSPAVEDLVTAEGTSRPAKLATVTKWAVVIAVTTFTTYHFDGRAHDLVPWLFSWRPIIFGSVVFTMVASLPFARLRPAVIVIVFLYEVALVYILATGMDLADVRALVNTTALAPLNETAYDTGCEVYDASHSQPFHNVIEKLDSFVWLHVIGYIYKFLCIRSWWLCHTLSVSFELLEYSLEHHLANFKECWWDHWIADALITNVLGMWIGSMIIESAELERYHWRQVIQPTARTAGGKIKMYRSRWRRLQNMILIAAIVCMVELGEVNTFYIKFLLWLPSEHWLCAFRVLLAFALSIPGVNEVYTEAQGRKRRFMPYLFVYGSSSMQVMELLVYAKLGHQEFTTPLPQHIILLWIGIIMVCVAYAVWRLLLRYVIVGPEEDELAGERHERKRLREKRTSR